MFVSYTGKQQSIKHITRYLYAWTKYIWSHNCQWRAAETQLVWSDEKLPDGAVDTPVRHNCRNQYIYRTLIDTADVQDTQQARRQQQVRWPLYNTVPQLPKVTPQQLTSCTCGHALYNVYVQKTMKWNSTYCIWSDSSYQVRVAQQTIPVAITYTGINCRQTYKQLNLIATQDTKDLSCSNCQQYLKLKYQTTSQLFPMLPWTKPQQSSDCNCQSYKHIYIYRERYSHLQNTQWITDTISYSYVLQEPKEDVCRGYQLVNGCYTKGYQLQNIMYIQGFYTTEQIQQLVQQQRQSGNQSWCTPQQAYTCLSSVCLQDTYKFNCTDVQWQLQSQSVTIKYGETDCWQCAQSLDCIYQTDNQYAYSFLLNMSDSILKRKATVYPFPNYITAQTLPQLNLLYPVPQTLCSNLPVQETSYVFSDNSYISIKDNYRIISICKNAASVYLQTIDLTNNSYKVSILYGTVKGDLIAIRTKQSYDYLYYKAFSQPYIQVLTTQGVYCVDQARNIIFKNISYNITNIICTDNYSYFVAGTIPYLYYWGQLSGVEGLHRINRARDITALDIIKTDNYISIIGISQRGTSASIIFTPYDQTGKLRSNKLVLQKLNRDIKHIKTEKPAIRNNILYTDKTAVTAYDTQYLLISLQKKTISGTYSYTFSVSQKGTPAAINNFTDKPSTSLSSIDLIAPPYKYTHARQITAVYLRLNLQEKTEAVNLQAITDAASNKQYNIRTTRKDLFCPGQLFTKAFAVYRPDKTDRLLLPQTKISIPLEKLNELNIYTIYIKISRVWQGSTLKWVLDTQEILQQGTQEKGYNDEYTKWQTIKKATETTQLQPEDTGNPSYLVPGKPYTTTLRPQPYLDQIAVAMVVYDKLPVYTGTSKASCQAYYGQFATGVFRDTNGYCQCQLYTDQSHTQVTWQPLQCDSKQEKGPSRIFLMDRQGNYANIYADKTYYAANQQFRVNSDSTVYTTIQKSAYTMPVLNTSAAGCTFQCSDSYYYTEGYNIYKVNPSNAQLTAVIQRQMQNSLYISKAADKVYMLQTGKISSMSVQKPFTFTQLSEVQTTVYNFEVYKSIICLLDTDHMQCINKDGSLTPSSFLIQYPQPLYTEYAYIQKDQTAYFGFINTSYTKLHILTIDKTYSYTWEAYDIPVKIPDQHIYLNYTSDSLFIGLYLKCNRPQYIAQTFLLRFSNKKFEQLSLNKGITNEVQLITNSRPLSIYTKTQSLFYNMQNPLYLYQAQLALQYKKHQL